MKNLIELLRVYNVFSDKIRIGNEYDGGYVINRAILETTDKLISIGMGGEDSFETQWLREHFTPVEAYDGTYDCSTICSHEFEEKLNKEIFYIKANVGYDSGEIPLPVLLDRSSNILLKVDIEGAEYKIFDNVKLGNNVVGFLLEVHDLHEEEKIKKLSSLMENEFSNFLLFHIHGNNWGGTHTLNFSKTNNPLFQIENFPNVMEFSFINKRIISNYELETREFPIHGIDFPNDREKEDIDLRWINAL